MKLSPKGIFCHQRHNAGRRGVEWQITFDDWWRIWDESGHWAQRGREQGCYCMARHGDKGPYAVGNVSIITSSQNVSDAKRKYDLPMGVYRSKLRFKAERRINGRLTYFGVYPTPELAHAAYLQAAA